MKNFSKKQIKDYLKNPDICPKCKKPTVKVSEEFTEETMSREINCENCDIEFYEVYDLAYIELK